MKKNIGAMISVLILILVIALAIGRMTITGDLADELIDERTEDGEHSFLTFTPSTIRQIYEDTWRVRPRKITGELVLPPGDGPFPAVVLYHGDFEPATLDDWFDALVDKLVAQDIATFVIDSFTGRRIPGTEKNLARLSRAARLVDIFQALNKLASFDEIDEDRIAINGYSFGGTTAIDAADLRIVNAGLARGRGFAAHLANYPNCQSQFRTNEPTGAPILILAGEKDNYSPAQTCVEYVKNLTETGSDVELKVYPDTHHGWITNYGISDCENCASLRNCGLMYVEENGHESALDGRYTTQFGWREYIESVYQECGINGVTLRVNQEASQDTFDKTISFLSQSLKQ